MTTPFDDSSTRVRPWAGDPRLTEAIRRASTRELGERLCGLADRVLHCRAIDGGKLWADPETQVKLGAVYDEITRRAIAGPEARPRVLFGDISTDALQAYRMCIGGVLDGRLPAERQADLVGLTYAERRDLVREWDRIEVDVSVENGIHSGRDQADVPGWVRDPGAGPGPNGVDNDHQVGSSSAVNSVNRALAGADHGNPFDLGPVAREQTPNRSALPGHLIDPRPGTSPNPAASWNGQEQRGPRR